MVVWLLFSIFPHFVLRNISLAGIWCSDVCKTVVNPFSALLVVFFCTALVSLCCVIYAFPKKKKRKLPLSHARESESLLFPFPFIVCVCVVNVVVMVVKITALREAKLSSFEKMYLRLCGFLTAIMLFFVCFPVRKCNPNKSWYPATKLPYTI